PHSDSSRAWNWTSPRLTARFEDCNRLHSAGTTTVSRRRVEYCDHDHMTEIGLVTGAGRGIGRAVADALAAAGLRVARVSLEDEPKGTPDGDRYYRTDVSRIENHGALLDRVASDLGEP